MVLRQHVLFLVILAGITDRQSFQVLRQGTIPLRSDLSLKGIPISEKENVPSGQEHL